MNEKLKEYKHFLRNYDMYVKNRDEFLRKWNTLSKEEQDRLGVKGSYGPNDGGYINNAVREAAKQIKRAQELYSQGHYPHSNARLISKDHALSIALFALKVEDEQGCKMANREHDEELFSDYVPSKEDQTRWNSGGYMSPIDFEGKTFNDRINEKLEWLKQNSDKE